MMSTTVELGIEPYSILDSDQMLSRNCGEPEHQILDFFESLLQRADIRYIINPDLKSDDGRLLIFKWNGVKCCLIRTYFQPVDDYCLESLMEAHQLKIAFLHLPAEKQMQTPNTHCLPFSFGYKLIENHYPVTWELYDWSQYAINYIATGNIVITHLPERGFLTTPDYPDFGTYRKKCSNALERVSHSGRYIVDKNFKMPIDFLGQVNNVFLAVAAPGCCPYMLDRYPTQLMAVGCAVVMPETKYPMPGGLLVPGVHYVKCRDDYQDLLEVIDGCSKSHLIQIGNNAKKFFKRNLTPGPLCKYIDDIVQDYIAMS